MPLARSERWVRMEALFLRALELPRAEWAEMLERECPDDALLRREVLGLLEQDARAAQTLGGIVEDAAAQTMDDGLSGRRLGVYRIERELGRGGMGTVYLAMRDDRQFHKRVAIKVVRRGLDTEDVLRRFRHERQILANLDHPNIARLLDGGVTPDGRPYLVMEYVDGRPIHRYCSEQRVTLEGKLELFQQVCATVSYAHRNLVIHRDLKPDNIVVTPEGGVKLLDFGIAKVLHGDSVSQTVTVDGERMFTPDYGSPEQLQGGAVTTGTDVYSLGAVLYELLTGKRPHALHYYCAEELERQIGRVDPAAPSTVVTDKGLAAALAGDLDNILLMAMRKEPSRRYLSPDEMAADLRRHRAGIAVSARRDALAYRAGKFVRRHRVGFAAACAAVGCLIGGSLIALEQAAEARRDREIAVAALGKAELERRRAEREAEASRAASREVERAKAASLQARDRAVAEGGLARQRLHETIRLASRALAEMNGELASLRGAKELRADVAARVIRYLEAVEGEAVEDPAVAGSLALAYLRVGDALGKPGAESLGDFDGALRTYRKAADIYERLRQQGSGPADVEGNAALVRERLAELARREVSPR